jgi:hypothetical protein
VGERVRTEYVGVGPVLRAVVHADASEVATESGLEVASDSAG